MSDILKHKLFNSSDCIPEQVMFDYIDGKLSGKESHIVEKHLLDCELCSDALEGLELVRNRGRIAEINKGIEKLIVTSQAIKEAKIVPFNFRIILSIAAAIILLIGGAFIFNYFKDKSKQVDVAELKENSSKESISPSSGSSKETVADAKPDSLNVKVSADQSTVSTVATKSVNEPIAQPKKENQIAFAEDKKTQMDYGSGAANGNAAYSPPTMSFSYTNPRQTDSAQNSIAAISQEQNYKGTKTVDNDLSNLAANEEIIVVNTPDASSKNEQTGLLESEKDKITIDETKKAEEKSNVRTGYAYSAAPTTTEKNDGYVNDDKPSKKGNKNYAANVDSKSKEKNNVRKESAEGDAAPAVSNAAQTNDLEKEQSISGNTNTTSPNNTNAWSTLSDSVSAVKDTDPEYPGGTQEILKFFSKNYKLPASSDKWQTSKGTKIIVQITVDAKGKVINPKIIKGINAEYNAEALRVVKIMPDWKPAMHNGKFISKSVTLTPIQLEIK